MAYVIEPPLQTSLPVIGTEARFPVRRVFCVGRNYAAHVREMGNDEREPPFFFTKPADALAPGGGTIAYPPQTADLHHEIELVILIGRGGADITPEAVPDHIWGAAVGVDLTRRDLQSEAKRMGRPWDMAKGFDQSAPIGDAVPLAAVPSLKAGRIWLAVNGTPRQDADLSEMIWPVNDHVATLSRFVALAPGDVVMTGTPAGVGPLAPGDTVTGGIDGLPDLHFTLAPRAA